METVKHIFIADQPLPPKKVKYEKKKKPRVETKTWGLHEEDLLHQLQLDVLSRDDFLDVVSCNDKYAAKMRTHIRTKLGSYKQQDVLKKKWDAAAFVSLEETVSLLKASQLACCYCAKHLYVLYEHVREMDQWSLDRIDNALGHNHGNVVIACLECNLKRKRTNKDAFMFTKNMVLIKATS